MLIYTTFKHTTANELSPCNRLSQAKQRTLNTDRTCNDANGTLKFVDGKHDRKKISTVDKQLLDGWRCAVLIASLAQILRLVITGNCSDVQAALAGHSINHHVGTRYQLFTILSHQTPINSYSQINIYLMVNVFFCYPRHSSKALLSTDECVWLNSRFFQIWLDCCTIFMNIPFNPLVVPAPHLSLSFLARQPSPHWKSDCLFRYSSSRLWNQLPYSFRQPNQSCLNSPPHSLVNPCLS